eukprot:9503255-Pyramimonas_sp.AAC.2
MQPKVARLTLMLGGGGGWMGILRCNRPPWLPESALGNESRFNTRFMSPSYALIRPGTANTPLDYDAETYQAALRSRCKTR